MRMCVVEREICNRAELISAREMMLKTSNKQKKEEKKKTKQINECL